MTREEIESVEKVMDGFRNGYAYLYPADGGNRQEYVFDMTPENIANFFQKEQLPAPWLGK